MVDDALIALPLRQGVGAEGMGSAHQVQPPGLAGNALQRAEQIHQALSPVHRSDESQTPLGARRLVAGYGPEVGRRPKIVDMDPTGVEARLDEGLPDEFTIAGDEIRAREIRQYSPTKSR